MRRKLVGVAVLSILFCSTTAQAESLPSLSGSCKEAGQTRLVYVPSSGVIRYVCKRVNKSLKWKPAPYIATSTIATTTTTTVPVNPITGKKMQFVSADILKRAEAARLNPSNTELEFLIAPSIEPSRAAELRKAILWAFSPWESQTKGAGTKVVIVDENGEAFWRANMPAGGGNCPGVPGAPAYVPPTRTTYTGYGCSNPDSDRVLYMGIGTDVASWPSDLLHHEVTHLAQYGIYISRSKSTVEPCFLAEGEATLYGYVLGLSNGGQTVESSGKRVASDIAKKYGLTTDNDWLKHLQGRDNRDQNCGVDYFNYFIGSLYVENLYFDFGIEKLAQWKALLPGRNWRDPFVTVFGTTPDEWYKSSLIPNIRELCQC